MRLHTILRSALPVVLAALTATPSFAQQPPLAPAPPAAPTVATPPLAPPTSPAAPAAPAPPAAPTATMSPAASTAAPGTGATPGMPPAPPTPTPATAPVTTAVPPAPAPTTAPGAPQGGFAGATALPVFQQPPPFAPAPTSRRAYPTSDEIEQFKSRKRGLIAGAVLFGLAYYGALTAGSVGVSVNTVGSSEYIPALIPVVGPFISAPLRADPNAPQSADHAGMALMLALGVTQAVGATLLIVNLRRSSGTAPPCSDLAAAQSKAPCTKGGVSLSPLVAPTLAGAGLVGSF